MKRKLLTETLVYRRERLVIISYTTGLSFAIERIGPLAAIITTVFYLLALYLFVLSNTPENPFASIYSEAFIKTTCQHLLLLVGFDTLIYRKYYDTPPILVGHQCPRQPSTSTQISVCKSSDFDFWALWKICISLERLVFSFSWSGIYIRVSNNTFHLGVGVVFF
jgi:hypothetical protein